MISCQPCVGFTLVTAVEVEAPGDADRLHEALLQSFADGTDAVVCDVSAASRPQPVVEALAAAVLQAAERVHCWPATVLAVVGAGPLHPAWATRTDLPPGLVVTGALPDAIAQVSAHGRVPTTGEVLEPLRRAPALARGFLSRTLAGWGEERFTDDALIVVDELVANAVLHAGTEIELRFALGDQRLGVAVADRSPRRPELEYAGDGAERGRGMLLVDALAGAWHVLPRRDGGKVVRAVLVAAEPGPIGGTAATGTAGGRAGLSAPEALRGARS